MGNKSGFRDSKRVKMSTLRRKISERLVTVKNETAMLTTFNEVDMKNVIEIRNMFKEDFKIKHEISLGYMSFFTKAVTRSLKLFPQVNSIIDSEDIVTFNYFDISIAVSSPKGLEKIDDFVSNKAPACHRFLETFTIRKIGANNIGVERIFPICSPIIEKIELNKKGKVRRARIFYLRNLTRFYLFKRLLNGKKCWG